MKNTKQYFVRAVMLFCALLVSNLAFADDGFGYDLPIDSGIQDTCTYPILATNLINPTAFGATNTTICVDVPVDLKKVKVIYNMDTHAVDGNGVALGLKHMVMLGLVVKDRIAKGLMDADDVSIIGIMHGGAMPWTLKAGEPGAAPDAAKQEAWMEKIFKLRKAGINMHLEVCGVTLNGAHKTKADVYTYDANGNPDANADGRIYVNQGAIGREIYLQQHGYSYINESYEDHGQ